MGVFTYSAEEDTPAAVMFQQIPENVKHERMERLMLAQQEIAFTRNNRLIGSNQVVIIDSINDDKTAVGRTFADCPEVDQEVIVTGDKISVGDMLIVEIMAVDGYDLIGNVVRG
jgi:ribosomal protein S12 methylthiotransferase